MPARISRLGPIKLRILARLKIYSDFTFVVLF